MCGFIYKIKETNLSTESKENIKAAIAEREDLLVRENSWWERSKHQIKTNMDGYHREIASIKKQVSDLKTELSRRALNEAMSRAPSNLPRLDLDEVRRACEIAA